jgi:DDE superfamily endonuclease
MVDSDDEDSSAGSNSHSSTSSSNNSISSGEMELDDMEDALVIAAILYVFQEELGARRFKMHQHRVDWLAHVNYLVHAGEFTRTYRMPYLAFMHLVQLLWNDVCIDEYKSMQSTRGESEPIFPELVVALGIRWMGGSDYGALKDWSGISATSFHRCIDLFLSAIMASDSPMLAIEWPSTESQRGRNAAAFQQHATEHVVFKGLVGVTDGLLVRTIQPARVPNPRSYFSGHYECFGLNFQGVAEAKLRFIYAGIGGPGSTPDITAYRALSISDLVEQLPDGYYVIGDAAYVPTERLLTPYTGAARGDHWKDVYNFYLSQMRIRIEMAFGRLTTKWRILRTPLQTNLDKTVQIVQVACRLHNYVINWQEGAMGNVDDDDDEIEIEVHINARGDIGYYESGCLAAFELVSRAEPG